MSQSEHCRRAMAGFFGMSAAGRLTWPRARAEDIRARFRGLLIGARSSGFVGEAILTRPELLRRRAVQARFGQRGTPRFAISWKIWVVRATKGGQQER